MSDENNDNIDDISNDKIFETKPLEAYPRNVQNQVYLLKINKNKDNAHIFGSYIYRFQKYAADVDILEEYQAGSSEKYVIDSFYKKFKKIVMDIRKARKEYFSEVKCGLDTRYDLKLGECTNGLYVEDPYLISEINELYKNGLLEEEDYRKLMEVLQGFRNRTSDDYDIVKFILRKYLIVRWSSDEIIRGYKVLQGNMKFSFKEGLKQNTLVKIDAITILDGAYVETTNVYYLAYEKDGEVHRLQDMPAAREGLKDEIEKLYFSNMWYSPFKCVKRMYSYCRLSRELSSQFAVLGEKVSHIAGSDISLLYQIKSEIDTILLILDHGNRKAIDYTLDSKKNKISNVLFLSDKEVIALCQVIDAIIDEKNLDKKEKYMEELSSIIKKRIEQQTIIEMEKIGINPPPMIVLPDHKIYKFVVRQPDSQVINPLKKKEGGHNFNDHYYHDTFESNVRLNNMIRDNMYSLGNRLESPIVYI